jgi:TRAP-type mannitol/chloroaromatic compound transport system permease small subunit
MDEPSSAGEARAPGWRAWLSFETLVSGLNSIGTLWIFALMVVIGTDVVGRTAFNAPLPGVLELVRLSIVGIVFIQLGHTLRAGRMTRADNLLQLLQRRWPRAGYGLQALFGVAGTALFAVLFYASFPFFLRSWNSGEYAGIEGYVTYPVWPVRLIILVGCVCAGLQYLLFAWRDLEIAMRGEGPVAAEQSGGEGAAYRAQD